MLDTQVTQSDQVSIKVLIAALGAFLTISTGILGIGFWAANIQARANEANARLDKVEMVLDAIPRIDRSVARIEGFMQARENKK